MIPAAAPVLAADAAFYIVFGAAAVAFVVLAVITLGWAFRQDRTGRERWLDRQRGQQETTSDAPGQPTPPATNGHGPTRRPGSSRRAPE